MKRTNIYILDPKNIPVNTYYAKLNVSKYWDEDYEPIDSPDDVRVYGEEPKLDETYHIFRQGKIGLLRNAKLDYSKEDDNGFIKNNDGTLEDPGYEPADVVNQGFEWAIVFNDCSWLAYQDTNHLVDMFTAGEFNLFTIDKN
jgi:hypothetical protein